MDKTNHLMAEKNKNNKDSQKGQVTPKKFLKSIFYSLIHNPALKETILNRI
jgi:hypothetical protein